MASPSAPDPGREYRLIELLELRIASADSDEKFESIIQRFLPALILKLESGTERNRNLAIKVCQYVNQRVKISQSIQLPVQGLVKNFREAQNGFVRRFSLLFVQQGLARIKTSEAPDLLPGILQFSVPSSADFDTITRKMWSISFDFLLDAMKDWRAPERGSKQDELMKESFSLNGTQCDVLVTRICHFLLYDPKQASSSHGLDDDFKPVFERQFRQRSQVVPQLAKFLSTSIFDDSRRLVPATILTVDVNAAASIVGDTMFKQCSFDMEAEASVDSLFELYQSAKPKLQTKILSLLSRSQKSTNKSTDIFTMVQKQLKSSETSLEASKLRNALFNYLTWAVRMSENIQEISSEVQRLLKEYIELQGWPIMHDKSLTEAELRAKAYESIGLLASKSATTDQSHSDIDLITWLFTSLRCDTTHDIRGSIEESLSRIMNIAPADNVEQATKLRELLLWNMTAQPGDEDPIYFHPTVNSTSYPAVRFANKCLPFNDPTARLIDVIATGIADRRELVEEGARGLDPYWHLANQRLSEDPSKPGRLLRPAFVDITTAFFNNSSYQTYLRDKSTRTSAVLFCRNTLVCEAISGTPYAIEDESEWKTKIDALVGNNQAVRSRLKEYYQQVHSSTLVEFVVQALQGLPLGSDDCADVAIEVLSLMHNGTPTEIPRGVSASCSQMLSDSAMQFKAARCLGIIESPLNSWASAVDIEMGKCSQWDSAIGFEAVKVRGHLLAANFVLTGLPFVDSLGK